MFIRSLRVCVGLGAVLAAFSTWHLTPRAWACSPLEACVQFPAQIPAGGVLIVRLIGGAGALDVEVTENGAKVEGSIEQQGSSEPYRHWAVFRPVTPFMTGHTYEVGGNTFEAVDAPPFDPSTLAPSTEVLAQKLGVGERIYCTDGAGGLCSQPYIDTRVYSIPQLKAFVRSDAAGATQWLIHGRFGANRALLDEVGFGPLPWTASMNFDTVPSGYCYELTAENAADGRTVSVAKDCLNSDLTIDERPLSDDEVAAALVECTQPDTDGTATWCALTRSVCARRAPPAACEGRASLCPDNQAEDPAADAPDTAVSDDSGAPSPRGAETTDESVHARASGCTLAGAPTAGPHLTWRLIGLALLAVWLRPSILRTRAQCGSRPARSAPP